MESHSPLLQHRPAAVQAAKGEANAKVDDDSSIIEDASKGVQMQRSVGLISGIGLIVGTIIGSGIFISPKGVLEGSGSVGLTLILWVACGVLATMGALVYAELGTAIPKSGGEHAYLFYTFNRHGENKQGGLGRVPAFLFDWTGLLIIRPVMLAVMALALGTYTIKPFFPDCTPPPVLVKLSTVVALCVITFLNCYSVKVATRLQNICTFTKLGALVIIAIGGIVVLAQGDVENFDDPFGGTSFDTGSIALAFYNGLWAYDGWNSLNFVTEELKNPSRNLPLAIMIGIPLTTACYVLANVGYIAVMGTGEIIASHAVAVKWGELMLGPYLRWLMPFFVVVSTFGSCNGCLFASGRLSYVAGREGHFPKVLGFINTERLTPVSAMIFTGVVSICFIIPGDLALLIDIFITASWLFYGWTTLSLLILRYTEPNLPRPYKVPLIVPVIMLISCLYLLLAPVIQNPAGNGAFTLLFLVVGLVVYVIFIQNNLHPPGIDKFTLCLQKLLLIVPSNPN